MLESSVALIETGQAALFDDWEEARATETDAGLPRPRLVSAQKAGQLVHLDPLRIRLSALNPRHRAAHDPKALAELRASIAAVGQRVPVIVRPLASDPFHAFELIAGSRRHRVACDRRADGEDVLLLAEIVDVDDRTAVAIADAENRGREALAEFERATFLARQLTETFGGDRAALCRAVGLSEPRLSRLLSLAAWPKPMLDAFGDPGAVRQRDAIALQRVLHGPTRLAALQQAKLIAQEQAKRYESGEPYLSPTEVRQRIADAVAPHQGSQDLCDPETGATCLTVRSATRAGISLFVPADRHQQAALLRGIQESVIAVRRQLMAAEEGPA